MGPTGHQATADGQRLAVQYDGLCTVRGEHGNALNFVFLKGACLRSAPALASLLKSTAFDAFDTRAGESYTKILPLLEYCMQKSQRDGCGMCLQYSKRVSRSPSFSFLARLCSLYVRL